MVGFDADGIIQVPGAAIVEAVGEGTGSTVFRATWADLSTVAVVAGANAQVPDTDTGTHTDPVTGGTVPNAGMYLGVTGTPSGWRRIAATQASVILGAADRAETAADEVAAAALTVPAINQPVAASRQRAGRTGMSLVSGSSVVEPGGARAISAVTRDIYRIAFPADVAVGETFEVAIWALSGAFTGVSIRQDNAASSTIADTELTITPTGSNWIRRGITRAAGAMFVQLWLDNFAAGTVVRYLPPIVARSEPARSRTDAGLIAPELLLAERSGGDAARNLAVTNFVGATPVGAPPTAVITGNRISFGANTNYDLTWSIGGVPASAKITVFLPIEVSAPLVPNIVGIAHRTDARGGSSGAPVDFEPVSDNIYRVTMPASADAGKGAAFLTLYFQTIGVAETITVDLDKMYLAATGGLPTALATPQCVADDIATAAQGSVASAVAIAALDTADALYGTQAQREAMNRQIDALMQIGVWVNKRTGSDTNNGLARATAVATLEHALTIAAPAGKPGIGLLDGTRNYVSSDAVTASGRPLIGYGGNGVSGPAMIDGRLPVTGWTVATGNVQTTTFVMRGDPLDIESGQVWDAGRTAWQAGFWTVDDDENETAFDWQYGSGSIAGDEALVDAAPGRFSIKRVGSANANVRNDDSAGVGTLYAIRAHFPAGVDPNTIETLTADLRTVINLSGGAYLNGVGVIGCGGKDAGRSNPTEPPIDLINYVGREAPGHAWVGPANTRGSYYADGRSAPGTTYNGYKQAMGHGFNFARSTDGSTYPLEHDVIHVKNFSCAVYGHGPSALGGSAPDVIGAKSQRIRHLISENCGQIYNTNHAGGSSYLPFITEGCVIDRLTADPVITGFGVGNDIHIRTGTGPLAFEPRVPDGQRILAVFDGPFELRIEDMDIDSSVLLASNRRVFLAQRNYPDTLPDPKIFLAGGRNLHTSTRQLTIFPGTNGAGTSYGKMHLELVDWVGGDFLAPGAAIPFASIKIGPGCIAGFGGRTRSELIAYCDANGIEHDISGMAGLVNYWGALITAPGA